VDVSIYRKLLLPGVVGAAFWALAIIFFRTSGYLQPLFLFGYIGTALALGLSLYATLPKRKKQYGRRLTLALVGGLLLVYVGVIERENVQIEWVFFSIMAGLAGAALVHYLIAKIIGPLLFGRLWCGWACWTLMVLDLLPFQRSPGRLPGRWAWIRYGHFALSLVLVTVLSWGVGYRDHVHFGSTAGLGWLLAGNGLYYALGIGLAFRLRDNRAFCKYVCPVTVFLKAGARFSVLKVAGDMTLCTECGACERMCPMDIRILDYIRNGQRVLSTECMLCQTCITVCATDALRVSAGLDAGGQDRLRPRPPEGWR
jgi:ferredoxin-type protein NapH